MLDRARQLFADQFESDGDRFLYRRSGRSAPVSVNAEERARFVAAYDAWLRRSIWSLALGVIALITIQTIYFPSGASLDWASWIGVLVLLAIYLGLAKWIWNAPARELRGRGNAGEARSGADVRRRFLEKQSYAGILWPMGLMILVVFGQSRSHDLFSGWYRLWLVALLFTIGTSAYSLVRKWRWESSKEN